MTKFYTDKQKIIDWLKKHEVKNYILVPDEKYGFVVNVTGDVDLSNKDLTSIPVKFNKISGSFYCYDNQLTSLEFSPQTVDGNFNCSGNRLTSLEFSPQAVSGSFWCHYNKLTSLKSCPKTVGSHFYCYSNKLTSLEFCPQTVKGSFYCEDNPKLKEIQKIINFKLILLEHKKILVTKFSDKLENDLSNDNSKKTAKIKI